MKFESKKEEFIYYMEKSKFFEKIKDYEKQAACIEKAKKILKEIGSNK